MELDGHRQKARNIDAIAGDIAFDGDTRTSKTRGKKEDGGHSVFNERDRERKRKVRARVAADERMKRGGVPKCERRRAAEEQSASEKTMCITSKAWRMASHGRGMRFCARVRTKKPEAQLKADAEEFLRTLETVSEGGDIMRKYGTHRRQRNAEGTHIRTDGRWTQLRYKHVHSDGTRGIIVPAVQRPDGLRKRGVRIAPVQAELYLTRAAHSARTGAKNSNRHSWLRF
ncbi:hypothetical protein B0H17DRAFT_1147653 [Mycena rosella]|uniref:Uncharacterized protein n=1 Tax=Mycena rosella TaxID=1033263 RepID=A0AAD7CNR0_MYCRO|nr:hypothetical protein B0H17DRAFT_1147653 [Mycena rosella]